MSLYKRGGVWWSYIYVDGIRQQHSTGATNRRQAQLVEQKLKAQANARRHELVQVDRTRTFTDLAARFVAQAGPRLYHLERIQMLLPYFADKALVKISKAMTKDYRRLRKAEKPIKDATINRDLSVLRHMLFWAVDEGLLVANPLSRLRLERERRTYRPVLSVGDESKLLTASAEHLAWIIVAAVDTGMRRGEILGQLWEDIDFERQLLWVTRSKTPEGESREIPLNQSALYATGTKPPRRGSGLRLRRSADQDCRISLEGGNSSRRNSLSPLSRLTPHVRDKVDGSRGDAGGPHGPDGSFQRRASAFRLRPRGIAGQARRHSAT